MKNILNKIKINYYTYFFILLCCICGYIKNIVIIFFICIFHEMGHVLFIKLFKYQIVKIEIFPFGGYTEIYKKINSSILKDLIIGLGGMLFQLILMLLLIMFKKYFNIITYNLFIKYNLTILIFNMLPIIPLDGSKIIQCLFEYILPYTKAYHFNIYLSILLIIIFIYLNYQFHIDNYFICSFLIYKIIIYCKDYKYLFKRFLLERSLYEIEYRKINNHTKEIKNLKKGVLHYFYKNKKYIREDKIINEYLGIKN